MLLLTPHQLGLGVHLGFGFDQVEWKWRDLKSREEEKSNNNPLSVQFALLRFGDLFESDDSNFSLQFLLFSFFSQIIVDFSTAEDHPLHAGWVLSCRTVIWD